MWHQKTLAINFANGYGINYINASVADLSLWNTETLFRWPPLNAFLTGVVYYIVHNIDWAVSILDCLTILILFSAVRSIVFLLQLSEKQQWFVWLLFLLNPLLTDLFSTSDLLSLSFWMWSFYLAYHSVLIDSKKQTPLLLMVFIGFLPAAFRYQYYPLIFIMPVCLFLLGVRYKEKKLLIRSSLWAGGLFVLLFLQIVVLKFFSSAGIPVTDVQEFSPDNLSRMAPFFLYSFFPAYMFINSGAQIFSYNIVFLYQIVGMISLVTFCVYLITIVKSATTDFKDYFFKSFSLISIFSVFMMLCILSLYYRKQINGGTTFTYVQEPRYWGVVFILIPLFFIVDKSFRTKTILRMFLISCIVLNAILLIYRLQKTNPMNGSAKMQTKKAIALAISTIIVEDQRPVIFACKDKDFGMYNFNKPYATVHYDSLMMQSKINTTKPIWFFLITGDKKSVEEERFIKSNQMVLLQVINNRHLLYKNQ